MPAGNRALIATTRQGQLDVSWLDMPRNPQRQAAFPNAHQLTKISSISNTHHPLNNEADGYQSYGYRFPTQSCFDYQQLHNLLSQLKVVRLKGIVLTN